MTTEIIKVSDFLKTKSEENIIKDLKDEEDLNKKELSNLNSNGRENLLMSSPSKFKQVEKITKEKSSKNLVVIIVVIILLQAIMFNSYTSSFLNRYIKNKSLLYFILILFFIVFVFTILYFYLKK